MVFGDTGETPKPSRRARLLRLVQATADEPASHASSEAPAAASYVAVDLTPSGTFKYKSGSQRSQRRLARPARPWLCRHEYHADVFAAALPVIEASGLTDVTCTGGGRIRHDAGSKLLITVLPWLRPRRPRATEALCRKAYPAYEISWSNDGYQHTRHRP